LATYTCPRLCLDGYNCLTDLAPLAIIGAACRLPGGSGLTEFADLLLAGRDAISEIPEDRWTKSRYFHPAPGQPGKTYSFAAGCLSDIDAFDAAFFGISPREALSVDPQQRIMLELAYEAIEDAGLLPTRLAGSHTAVFIGASSWDFAATSFADTAGLDAYAMQGAALSSVSNRVSYMFGLRGPSLTVDTACSSSLVALHLACEALRRGDAGLAIVGGVNLLLAPQSFVGFARASMLSRSGRCHPFDARADGYVRAEGGGAIVLKPLAQAVADGDEIRAVVRATGVNSDGRTAGFSMPSGPAQAALLSRVYAEAGIAPDDLCYFEAHGTGTPVGDPIEAYAIGEALARHRRHKLPIGSVKSNVGHLEPASGMAGLMKLLVTFKHGVVPQSLNFATPNPAIPFKKLNLEVTSRQLPFPSATKGAVAGINSFGFGGTNAHAILAAPPPPTATPGTATLSSATPSRATPGSATPSSATLSSATPSSATPGRATPEPDGVFAPLLLSARSTDALRALAATWRDTLADTPPEQVPALLRGAARYRDHYAHRAVVAAGDAADLTNRLDAWLADLPESGVVAGHSAAGGLAFVFSGNGSQWAGMALDALAFSPSFRAALDKVDALLAPELGWSVAARLRDEALVTAVRDTSVAQPLLFAIQVASVTALGAMGIRADAHVGHSAGEVAAAWASGALTLPQACHVIIQRSLMQRATHGAGLMAALGTDEVRAASLLGDIDPQLSIAAVNAASSVTVAGPGDAIQRLEIAAKTQRVGFTRLDLDYAFHSPVMDPIRDRLITELDGLRSAKPTTRMISTVTAIEVADAELDAEYWWHNVRLPVRFRDAVDRLLEQGIRIFLEVGPQPVLQSYLRDALQRGRHAGQHLASLSRQQATTDPFIAIAAHCHVAGANLGDATRFDGPANLRDLPRYPWQRQRFTATRTVEAVEVAKPVYDHPLLGFRDPLSHDAWMSHLSTSSEPWLADHVLDGVPVLPAAAMIEMMLAAARVRHADALSLEIQDLEIARALPLEAGALRDCRTSVDLNGYLRLASRPRLSTDEPLLHATGRILAGLSTSPVLPAVAFDGAAVIDAAAVYATAEALHLHYGAEFRTVVRVYRVDTTHAVADLQPPVDDRAASGDWPGYLMDPALVDGSLQALLVLAADQSHLAAQSSVVPWRFGRVRLLRSDGAQPRRAALHLRSIGPRSICADIALIDATGAVVAELIDCWFVAMPLASQALADKTFWTAYVPSARQPRLVSADLMMRASSVAPGVEEMPESALLAEAFLAAASFEALRPLADPVTGLLPDAASRPPLRQTALGWLAEDGYAEPVAQGWRLVDSIDLPPSAEIWRSLFFEAPQAPAENAVLATIGPALARGGADAEAGLLLSATLQEHLLTASPSATHAMEALLRAVGAVTAAWPAGRCLRVAIVGMLQGPLPRRLVERMAQCAIPLRLVVLAHDPEALGAVRDVVARTPGVVAKLWDGLAEEERNGFDLVLDVFGLHLPGRTRVTPEALSGLMAPSGLLLCVEPVHSRAASVLFGPALGADTVGLLETQQTLCASLRDAGLAAVQATLLDGAIWPVTLLVASASTEELHAGPEGDAAGLVVFAAPDDPLAAALAARQTVLRVLPIEAMKDALTAPFAARLCHVLLLAADPTEDDAGAELLPELLAEISAALLRMPSSQTARLWLVSPGSPAASVTAALAGLRRVAANELPALQCHAVCLDLGLPAAEAAERILRELADPDAESEAYWRSGGRLVPRLRRGLPPLPPVAGPRVLKVQRPGLIGSLAWVPTTPPAPGPGEVAVEVRAAALNFRDVMWAQGLLPDEAVQAGFSGPSLGLECAGVVTSVGTEINDLAPGDHVIAVAPAALATHVVTRRAGVMRVPAGLDFAAAATIPVAFMTAVHALGRLARLDAGETVLIHGGAGGVGLAAIQYALHKGAVVYATAGSEMRRQALRMLGVAGVFDSRSTSFVDDVLAATGGEGVDVVLNSLSGEAMQQSVRLLRPFGRFLEIGKRDLYRNTAIGVRPLRHNAAYFAVDIDELMASRPADGLIVLQEVSALLEAGALRPLPFRAFGFADAINAFRLLQSSGHVGKVVLLPETTPPAVTQPVFTASDDGVYLVTGGLSGFGLDTARWLARHGARRLALVSRRGAHTPDAAEVLAAFAEQDVDARAFACDVADLTALQGVCAEMRRTMGPIRGVLHAAMVLDDAYLQHLDVARFTTVIRPKLAGAAALDQVTRGDPVELFVLFSSITTVIGTPGQANYVAANAAMEALAERRRAAGLPALAVQWGPISDAGYLARDTKVSEMLAKMLGSRHLRAAEALEALPMLLQAGRCVVGVADVAWGDLRSRLPGLAGPFWSEMPTTESGSRSSGSIRAEIAGLSPDDANRVVLDVLVEELARILQLTSAAIDVDRPIHEFGVDSLMAVELQTALEGRLGLQLPLAALTGSTNLRAVPPRLLQTLQAADGTQTADVAAAILRHENETLPVAGPIAGSDE